MEIFALKQAISFHIIISYLLLAIIIGNLFVLLFIKDFVKINKISWYLTPLFFGILAILLFSGLSLLAMTNFQFRPKIFLMIIVGFVFFLDIVRIKKLRKTRKNRELQASYITFSRILNTIYILFTICLLVF